MKLYHGTSYVAAKKIIDEKKIKRHSNSVYDNSEDFSTNKEYVYLTNNIAFAIRYARNSATQYDDKRIVLFMLGVDEASLLPDYDQLRQATQELPYMKRTFTPSVKGVYTLEKSLKLFNSCCINKDISANEYVINYIVIDALRDCNEKNNIYLLNKIDDYLFLGRGRDDDYTKEWEELEYLEKELLAYYEFVKL